MSWDTYIPTHATSETLTPNLLPLLVLLNGCGCPEHLAYGVTRYGDPCRSNIDAVFVYPLFMLRDGINKSYELI